MQNFNLGEVLTRSWQIIWKHKVLWVFGILASFARSSGGGSGSGGSSGGGGGGGNSGYQPGSGDLPFSNNYGQGMEQFGRFIEQNIWIVVAGVIVLILLSILFYAVGIIGRIGLIKGVYKVESGAAELSFGELWSESLPYFWRIFGMSFLIGLGFLVLFIPLALFGVVTGGVGFLCMIPIVCILVPVMIVLTVVLEQAQPAIVIENLGILDGLKRGWEIVKTNAVTIIIMAIVLAVGSGIVGVVIALPIILAFLPILFNVNTLGESFTPLYIAAACCTIYLPVLIALNGLLTAYLQSAWTLTFMRLTQPVEPPQNNAPIFVEGNA